MDEDGANQNAEAKANAEEGNVPRGQSEVEDVEGEEEELPHWSLWDYPAVYNWSMTIEDALPTRDVDGSTKAIINTRLALPEVKLILTQLQVGISETDITPTGWGDEYLIAKMKPIKWAAIRTHLNSDNPMQARDGNPAQLTAPESYRIYDDLCTVLYLKQYGPHGILEPKEVAVSIERHVKLPEPWKIHRMYHPKDKKRLNSVLVYWYTHKERSQALSQGFLKVNREKCQLKVFVSPTKITRPREKAPLNNGNHGQPPADPSPNRGPN